MNKKAVVNNQTLQDIANAIRSKTGKNNLMVPSEMANEIENEIKVDTLRDEIVQYESFSSYSGSGKLNNIQITDREVEEIQDLINKIMGVE